MAFLQCDQFHADSIILVSDRLCVIYSGCNIRHIHQPVRAQHAKRKASAAFIYDRLWLSLFFQAFQDQTCEFFIDRVAELSGCGVIGKKKDAVLPSCDLSM